MHLIDRFARSSYREVMEAYRRQNEAGQPGASKWPHHAACKDIPPTVAV